MTATRTDGTPASAEDLLLPEGAHLVHIGPHKTGTTTLQGAFHLAREAAAAQGVRYAGRGRQPRSAVCAVVGKPLPGSGQPEPPPMWHWVELAAEIRGSGVERVVLSSENLADAATPAIQRIAKDLGPDRIHIAVTLRPLAKILPSQWQQYVQNRYTKDFGVWLDAILNRPRGDVTPSFWQRHRHDELIGRWAEVVGPANVSVIVLDETDRAMVLRVFEDLVGLSRGTLAPEPGLANRSLTLEEIEVVRAFNVEYRNADLPARLYERVMRNGAASYLQTRTPGADEGRIELPPWAVETVRDIATTMVQRIGGLGVRVVGDLEALAAVSTSRTADEPEADGAAEVRVAPEIGAATAMGILLASGLARGKPDLSEGSDEESPIELTAEPVAEPVELFRVTTAHLALVLLRRLRAAARRRLRRLFGRS